MHCFRPFCRETEKKTDTRSPGATLLSCVYSTPACIRSCSGSLPLGRPAHQTFNQAKNGTYQQQEDSDLITEKITKKANVSLLTPLASLQYRYHFILSLYSSI